MASKWLRRAADNGNADAQFALGLQLDTHTAGLSRQQVEAVSWYRKAAAQGHTGAQNNLAVCIRNGRGVAQDESAAVKLYEEAASGGLGIAQFNLATCYVDGIGVAQDIPKALQLFQKAEANGVPVARLQLLRLQPSVSPDAVMKHWRVHCTSLTLFDSSQLVDRRLLSLSAFGQAVKCALVLDDSSRRDVVVKVPRDQVISASWLSEWLALDSLPQHRHVLRLLGLCEHFETKDHSGAVLKPPLSFVTRFYAKGSIEDFFKLPTSAGRSKELLLPWAVDVALGLSHLHAHGVVHRDLAARNVFIDEHHRAVIGDLGLARRVDERKGVFVSENKSAAYPVDVAAEVLRDHEYSTASDVFSFGLLLFDIATECKYSSLFTWNTFSSSEQRAIAQHEGAAAKGYPDLMSKLAAAPARSKQLVDLILQCLAFEPSQRPKATELVAQLQTMELEICLALAVPVDLPAQFRARPPDDSVLLRVFHSADAEDLYACVQKLHSFMLAASEPGSGLSAESKISAAAAAEQKLPDRLRSQDARYLQASFELCQDLLRTGMSQYAHLPMTIKAPLPRDAAEQIRQWRTALFGGDRQKLLEFYSNLLECCHSLLQETSWLRSSDTSALASFFELFGMELPAPSPIPISLTASHSAAFACLISRMKAELEKELSRTVIAKPSS